MNSDLACGDVSVSPPQTTDLDIVKAARDWLGQHDRIAVATVTETWGSAPVPVGGQMLIAPDGHFMGSVSGGCVEGDVLAAAEEVVRSGRPRSLGFGVENETAWRAGLPCGGRINVYVEGLTRGSDEAFLDGLLEARQRREMVVVETALATGERRLYQRSDANPEPVRDVFRRGTSRLITPEVPEKGDAVFLRAVPPPIKVILIGATHITQVLSEVLRLAGYEATVVDPRTAYASENRFANIARITEWPEIALPRLGLDRHTAIVTLTHVDQIDEEALSLALKSDCLYIGAIGSRRTAAKRTEKLLAKGFTEADLARIHGPVGLNIGAKTPPEIAVSIAAEIISAHRGGGKAAA